jgi:hypothetical protein
MLSRHRQFGVTLTEMTVVAAVVALLVAFGLPAVRTFYGSFESGGSLRGLISAGLASARAIAAKEQHYAGIRFQEDLEGHQYMIFIIQDPNLRDSTGYLVPSSGFRVVEGIKPVKLPERVRVMDSMVGSFPVDLPIASDQDIDEAWEVYDATTFSVVFSPTGKLVVRNVQVLRRILTGGAIDTVFNDPIVTPMFEDDYDNSTVPFQQELSRNSFVVYDKSLFDKLNGDPRFNYLQSLDRVLINPYTGTIISSD